VAQLPAGYQMGGILADDMGLGKTIQALSFLQYYRTQNETLKALVVCPTTLIYNWENEIRKVYTQAHASHSSWRRTYKEKEEMMKYDITITTYGTLRSDIKLLTSIAFD
jgi:non-specific serine/threonine protein kinase